MTTVVPGTALGSSHPPSSSVFAAEAVEVMTDIVPFLALTDSSLLINVYPSFAYKSDPADVNLDCALFTTKTLAVQDGSLGYYNLFDSIVDSFYTAMEKVRGHNVTVVVSESGWPSAGSGEFNTPELAGTYNRKFIKHISSRVGTPKRPGQYIAGYIFAMFNENQKPGG